MEISDLPIAIYYFVTQNLFCPSCVRFTSVQRYKLIRRELREYDEIDGGEGCTFLQDKPEIICVNKRDLGGVNDAFAEVRSRLVQEANHTRVVSISTLSKEADERKHLRDIMR